MSISVSFSSSALPSKGNLALVIRGNTLGTVGQALDKTLNGAITRAMKVQAFRDKAGESLLLIAPNEAIERLLIISAGKSADEQDIINVGGKIYAAAAQMGASVAVAFEADAKEAHAQAAYGASLRSYRFDKYRTTLKDEEKPKLKTLTFHTKDAAAAKTQFATYSALSEAIFLTRDFVSEPPNVLYPESYAKQIVQLEKLGLTVKVLDLAALKKLKMGALLGVAQGSIREPRVVCLEWMGGKKKDAPVALLGKGVCFDSGGISIKPAAKMEEMKWDMAGSAAVVGTLMALAKRKAKANVVGIVGLVENMPDGNAQRPGDIVTSMSGQTIEVQNTDAEGRLVLCDVMTYAQRTYKPKLMVDLATLTGAVIVALGHDHAGILSNNQSLTDQLIAAGKATGEKLWQLPINETYHRDIDCAVADMKNIGTAGESGTISGAVFLERFVENGTPWAHLDIAGTAWAYKDTATCSKGASGFGVQLLNRFIAEHHEK